MKNIYRLRYWSNETAKVKERIFLKSVVLVGSDTHCDFVISDLQAIHSRIDFANAEFENLISGIKEKIKESDLFQIEKYIFQWKEVKLSTNFGNIKFWAAGFLIVALLVLAGVNGISLGRSKCRGMAYDFWQLNWRGKNPEMIQGNEMRKAAQQAIERRDYRMAKLEIEGLLDFVKGFDRGDSCGSNAVVSKLARDYINAVSRDEGLTSTLRERFQLLQRFWAELIQSDREIVSAKLIKIIRKHYLQGYRLSETNAAVGERMIDDAEAACEILGLSSDCYRPQTSHQTEK